MSVGSSIPRLFQWSAIALLLVAGIELAFRLAIFPGWRDLQHDMYVRHPVFGHYTKPNLDIRRLNPGNWDVRVRTNALGMRGLPGNLERELAGIWLIGDSNAFGGYVDDAAILSARLGGRGMPVANLASEGHDLSHQARVVRWLGQQGHRPRAVVAAVSLYHGIRPYRDMVAELNRPLPEQAPESRPRAHDILAARLRGLAAAVPASGLQLRAFLRANSAAYGWVKSGIMGVPVLRTLTIDLGLRTDLDLVYPFGLDLLAPMDAGNPARDDLRGTADFLAATGALVERMFGVRFAVVLLPAHHQIYPAAFARWQSANGLEGRDLDPLRSLQGLKDELAARGVPVLDPLDALRAAPGRVTFPDDGHLNALGHRVVADALAAWLPTAVGVEAVP